MSTKKGKQEERFKTHIKTRDFYVHYSNMYFRVVKPGNKNGVLNKESKFYVDYETYCAILDEFNLEVRDLILYKSLDFNMPNRMGSLGIRKRKLTPWFDKEGKLINPLPVDWKTTMELWEADPEAKKQKKLARHYNPHTKGYVAKWTYNKYLATYTWKSAYTFIPCRTAKLLLGKVLKDPKSKIDYYLA